MLKSFKQYFRHQKLRSAGLVPKLDRETIAYGDRSGMWNCIVDILPQKPIVYSFGVGNNIAWDLQMVNLHNAELHAFDPTPRSVKWMEKQQLPHGFQFHPTGLSNHNGTMEFFVPRKSHKVNYSSIKVSNPEAETVSCPVKRFDTIADELGHTAIDILKMDIEGGEMEALPDILNSGIPVGQILAEFHYHYPAIEWGDFTDVMEMLNQKGYDIFHISERGYEISLVSRSLVES